MQTIFAERAHSMFRPTRIATPTLFAAVFLAAAALAGPAGAATKPVPVDRVEMRINDLHGKLHITSAQEVQWTVVAQAMRDNAKSMDALIKARAAAAKTMTAVDDLHSYEELAEAHRDGLKNFTPLFETLYAGMSDEQKKDADAAFRSHASHGHSKS